MPLDSVSELRSAFSSDSCSLHEDRQIEATQGRSHRYHANSNSNNNIRTECWHSPVHSLCGALGVLERQELLME